MSEFLRLGNSLFFGWVKNEIGRVQVWAGGPSLRVIALFSAAVGFKGELSLLDCFFRVDLRKWRKMTPGCCAVLILCTIGRF